ncbi:hypothetical protein [Microcoleus sp. N9_A1]|uniref:hypothetical protein n=1 Tax=Microcoleus sp. N9_A1 TaxID=3055380 RepID=UPI002FCFE675
MRQLTRTKITILSGETIVKKSDRFQMYLHNGKIIELEDSFFWQWGDEPIPFGDESEIATYKHGYVSTLDEAIYSLISAAMSPE